MDNQKIHTTARPRNNDALADTAGGSERLNLILAANADLEIERKSFEASLMKHPLTTEKAFAYFGLLLGLFPPAAIFFKLFSRPDISPVVLILFTLVNLVCAIAGYFSGKVLSRWMSQTEKLSWSKMLLTTPFIGMIWGIMAGGAGGILIFVIGAFFGAFFGASVGTIAFPAFAVFRRLLKRGELIEQKHFLPLAFGISLAISAFILGWLN